jgi:hypothetical protein
MSLESTFILRREELRRRVEALPREVEAWRGFTTTALDMDVHFSQLNAISTLMEVYVEEQRAMLDAVGPGSPPAYFQADGFELIKLITNAQHVWDFFRDKLDLRFSPTFKIPLWVADAVAWSCHRPVLELAAKKGILDPDELREPPLTYLTADYSPATWVRGSRPNDGRNYHLGTSNLPIPIIGVPWDHVENFWEFTSIQHEVGHDIEADLKLRPSLSDNLRGRLDAAGVSASRIDVWVKWEGEVFADLVGLQLGGPAFADSMIHLLMLPVPGVTVYSPDDPHPTPYVRVLMLAAYIRELVPEPKAGEAHERQIRDARSRLDAHAREVERTWVELYGSQPQLEQYAADFPHVFRALMDTAMPELKGLSVRSLMPFSAADDVRIRAAAAYLATGDDAPAAGSVAPRHCVSAARLAVKLLDATADDFGDRLEEVNRRTADLVRDNTPPGLRGGDDTTPHKKFIASFADRLIESFPDPAAAERPEPAGAPVKE